MVNRTRASTQKFTDYTQGSVARTFIEAASQEVDALYQELIEGLVEAVLVSVFRSFNFGALPPRPASNVIRVTVAVQSTAILIPATTSLTRADGSMTYAATSDTTVPAGASFVDVPVAATIPGTVGNMPANGSFVIGITIPGFVSAVNLSAFQNGTNAELPAEQLIRFNSYVQTLSRGITAALEYALTQLTFLTDSVGNVTERVASVNIVEPYENDPTQPPGLIQAYIYNGIGGTSGALIAQAIKVLTGYVDSSGKKVAGYKAAGTRIQVSAASEIPLNVIGMLTIAPTFDGPTVVAQVTSVLYSYIQSIPVGEPYLGAVADSIVMQVPGVWNWMAVTPAPYVVPPATAKLQPGTFQIIGWLASRTTIQLATTGLLV